MFPNFIHLMMHFGSVIHKNWLTLLLIFRRLSSIASLFVIGFITASYHASCFKELPSCNLIKSSIAIDASNKALMGCSRHSWDVLREPDQATFRKRAIHELDWPRRRAGGLGWPGFRPHSNRRSRDLFGAP